ncbi:CAP domain-containing protein [Frigidibacter sp. MR17.24]|uniref:CAP domain-containing protein n=1 Tax=Frigidibacter sp. MR17.24 TaxID=3127345 RepID=UPI0030130594
MRAAPAAALAAALLATLCAGAARAEVATAAAGLSCGPGAVLRLDRAGATEGLARLNALRAGAGLAPVALSAVLSEAAEGHACDMVRRGYFDHRAPEGTGPMDRVLARGADICWVAENIAATTAPQDPIAQALAMWRGSPGHLRNMLAPEARGVGLAAIRGGGRTVWVMVLGRGC